MLPKFDHGRSVEEAKKNNKEAIERLEQWKNSLCDIPFTHLFDDVHELDDVLNQATIIAGWTEVGPDDEAGHSIFFGFFKKDKAILYPDPSCHYCSDQAKCPASTATQKQEGTWSEIFAALLEIQMPDIPELPR